jgi:hypothetical protein
VRSRIAVDISAEERMRAGSRTGAELTEAAGPVVIGGASVVAAGPPLVPAIEAVGRPEDIVDPEQYDTKLIGARVLPGLGRRLYEWKGGWRGWRRGRRRHGAVAAPEEEGGGALEAAARVSEFRLLRETTTNMFIDCLNT